MMRGTYRAEAAIEDRKHEPARKAARLEKAILNALEDLTAPMVDDPSNGVDRAVRVLSKAVGIKLKKPSTD